MTKLTKIIISAVCIAMCVVLPLALHAIPGVGNLISPMHIPVLLCGLVCGPVLGGFCGIAGVLLSSIITQMPPMAYMPVMAVELFFYGLAAGILMMLISTEKYYLKLYISLIGSMALGRIAAGIAQALIFSQGSYTLGLFVSSYVVGTLPGMAIHLILIPAVISALKKAKLI